jgi:hypothetical protein
MTQISRIQSVPTSRIRPIKPAASATGSNTDQNEHKRRDEPDFRPVPTRRAERRESKSQERARPVLLAAQLAVQIIAGAPKRGLKAEPIELARYRDTYAKAERPGLVTTMERSV